MEQCLVHGKHSINGSYDYSAGDLIWTISVTLFFVELA